MICRVVASGFFGGLNSAMSCAFVIKAIVLASSFFAAAQPTIDISAQTIKPSSLSETREGPSVKGREDEQFIEIDCSATLQYEVGPDNKPYFLAPIELEPLEAGKLYKLRISIYNPTNEPVSYSKIRVDCACAKFEANVDKIPALGEGRFNMYLTAPNTISDRAIATSAKFVDHESGQLKIRIQVLYKLSGVFGFTGDRFTIEIPHGEHMVVEKLPVVIQPPVAIDQLDLQVSDNLRDLSIKLTSSSDNENLAFVEVAVSKAAVASGTIMGEVGLLKRGHDHKSTAILSVQQQQKLSVFPESVRLLRENSTKPFQATATVRVSRAIASMKDGEDGPAKVESTPRIELKINGNPARLTIKPLGRTTGIYRVSIEYDGPVDIGDNGTVEAKWGIFFDGEDRVVKSYAFFPTLDHEKKGDE